MLQETEFIGLAHDEWVASRKSSHKLGGFFHEGSSIFWHVLEVPLLSVVDHFRYWFIYEIVVTCKQPSYLLSLQAYYCKQTNPVSVI